MTQAAADGIQDVQELAAQALALLDQAVGRAVRLPIRDRELVREYLLAPRNHLRNSVTSLGQKIETEEARAKARRAAKP